MEAIWSFLAVNVLERLDRGVIVVSEDYKIIFWNKWMADCTQITKSQAANRHLFEIFPSLKNSRIQSSLEGAIKQGLYAFISPSAQRISFPLIHPESHPDAGSSIKYQRIEISPLSLSPIILGLIQISDETSIQVKEKLLRDQAIALRKANAEKDRFFSILAHDLRGPLGTQASLLEILLADVDNPDRQDLAKQLSALAENATNIYKLMENLLQWGKARNSGYAQYFSKTDLLYLVEYEVSMATPQAQAKNILISINSDPEPVFVYIVQEAISTIIRNLISNAIKFSFPNGSIAIRLEKDSAQSRLSVHNHGAYIEKENIDKLFHLDSQYSTRGTANEKGAGLGLILCHELALANNGYINVDSSAENGTLFSLHLPLL